MCVCVRVRVFGKSWVKVGLLCNILTWYVCVIVCFGVYLVLVLYIKDNELYDPVFIRHVSLKDCNKD